MALERSIIFPHDYNGNRPVGAQSDSTGYLYPIKGDEDKRTQHTSLYVWDTDNLEWKRWDGKIDAIVNGDLIIAVDDLEDLISAGNEILTTISESINGLNPLTDTQLRASDVKVSLDGESVEINNFPASQAVTGPLTDAQLRATPVIINDDDLLQILRLIQQSVYKPPWFDGSANAIRIQAQSGTITTVTTVTNLTNFGSQSADMVNRYNSIQSWSLACRSRLT